MAELEIIPSFISEGLASEEELDLQYTKTLSLVEALELRNMLRGKEDKMGALMDIN